MDNSLHLRRMLLAGTFAAMGVALKVFSLTTATFRLSVYDIPLFIGGMVLGPAYGLLIGFVVDWLYVMISPFAFSFNLMTISAMLWGLMGGLLFYRRKTLPPVKLVIVLVVTSLLAFGLNSLQLYIWFGPGMFAEMPFRIVAMTLKWPIQFLAIKLIYERVLLNTPFVLSNQKH